MTRGYANVAAARTTSTTTTITTTNSNNINTTIPLSTTCSTPPSSSSSSSTSSSSNSSPHIVKLPSTCIQHIFSFLNRSDLLKTCTVSKDFHLASVARLWSNFKFVREREFERIFHILSKRSTIIRYGDYITSLELIHSDRDFSINSNHIFLITMLCPNLLSISITFHHTHPVAPPGPGPSVAQNGAKPALAAQHLLAQLAAAKQKQQQQQQPPQSRISPTILMGRQPQQQQQQQQPILSPHRPHHQQQQQPTIPRHTPSLPLAHFAHNCTKLKSIRLVSYSPKTDDSVYEMAKYLKSGSLESIRFTDCPTIQSSTLCKLAMTNPQLKNVEITGNTPISDSSLVTIADRCGLNLEYLSIGNAHQLSDKSMRYIAARCKKIRKICIFNNNVEKMSEDTLTQIIKNCSSLQAISLSDSRTLGPVFFDSVVQRVNIEMLDILNQQAKLSSGLQTICLGGVKRDMIQSRYINELIDKSASKHDRNSLVDDEEEEEEEEHSFQVSDIMSNHSFIPKSTVIRGNTIWWHRRRILLTSKSS